MLQDYFRIALSNLTRRKLRSWLTVIGIFIGIMAVVGLVSLSQGMENAILSEFKKMGTDRILVTPGGAEMGPLSGLISATKFTEADFTAVEDIRGIEIAISIYSKSAYLTFGRETKQQLVWGMPNDAESLDYYKSLSMFDVEDGRMLRAGDMYKAMIGWGIAYDFFDRDIKVGNTIYINGVPFEVIGIHGKKGGLAGDNVIRIPKDAAREVFNEPNEVTSIMIKSRDGFDVDDVAERVKKELRRSRDVKKGEEDFKVMTSAQAIAIFESVIGIVQAVLVGLALISLVVGGVGIMNTMYTSVVERTREIGIMKAVGARNSAIMSIFLIESGLLGVIGGSIGVLLGIGIGKAAEFAAMQYGIDSLQAYTGAPLIIGALVFSFIIGALSGALPALQASKLSPVDALRK
jgi:putative ABC transport system permease protein